MINHVLICPYNRITPRYFFHPWWIKKQLFIKISFFRIVIFIIFGNTKYSNSFSDYNTLEQR